MSLFDLPTEILAQVARYANLNGDLSSLRLSSSSLLGVASCQPSLLLEDLSLRYRISRRTLSLFLSQKHGRLSAHAGLQPGILDALLLGNFLHGTRMLGADVDRALSPTPQNRGPDSQLSSREPFVLFATFTQMLNASLTVSHSTASDLLAPSPNGEQAFSKSFSADFVRFLKQELTLDELEAIIGAINVCAMRLWSGVFMLRPKDRTVSGFGSLSGASFNADQAILTEHLIWRGPRWAARILEIYGPAERGGTLTEAKIEVDDILIKEGLWNGSREEGARLAANGVARLLWKERQERIEAKANASADKISIADLRVSSSVWRGSSGDL